MREIKFRFWNPTHNEMMHSEGINLLGETILCGEIHRRDNDEALKLEEILKLIPLQYTGLKDKNGKEIYEGDILKDHSGYLWQVVWNSDYACFSMKGHHDIVIDVLDNSNMEVIGNIYKNPELLKT